jgi:hypothetical protein
LRGCNHDLKLATVAFDQSNSVSSPGDKPGRLTLVKKFPVAAVKTIAI